MSFRLFIYYCALCGGCAAYIGWMLGWMAVGRGSENHLTVDMGVVGMHLGLLVALGLGLVDALWNHSILQIGQFIMRVAMAVALGGLGGLLGGLIGQGLVSVSPAFRVIGWTITGVLIGASLGAFDVLTGLVRGQELRAGSRKVLKGVVGGTIGGVLGGILYLLLGQAWRSIFHDKPFDQLWSPRATGFVALGLCIGLSIGLAQV
ncbi:MAG TPA: hypothetical protein VFA18_04325, partial [Gemmataceae bacterium]|nr:hypothetical protein [Gemmataceae bacterium]